MSARTLFEVSLRVLGMWLVASSIVALAVGVSEYFSYMPPAGGPSVAQYSVLIGALIAVQLGLGVVFVRWAPTIADRFYAPYTTSPENEAAAGERRVGPGDVYHTACYVLGAYLLVLGINAAGQLAVRAMFSGWQGSQWASAAVTTIVYCGSGLLLIFGSRPIGQLIASMKYDPESIPQQQFSLKMILIVTGIVAVILGLLRILSMRGS